MEFDWCGVNALDTINKEGYRSIMINYNPETVSTDYDVCDRLYFEELTFERVMDILDLENPLGVIVSTGGQIPNNLAMRLYEQDVKILGTSPLSIDKAENRHKFSAILDQLEIDQPRWIESSTVNDVFKFTEEVGFPVIVRPSYVLSGAAMNIVSNSTELEHFLEMAAEVSKQYPVVVSKFIEDSKEIEMDAVARDGEIICYAISEHVEFAGVHSGDATMLFPPQKIYVETVRRIKRISRQIAEHLKISGPFNIQFLAKDNDVMVIECNLRASRSFPFISKVLKTNFIEIATKIMLGKPVTKPDKSLFDLDYVGVKASQFSFSRLQKADPVLGVEMVSTGEVGCIGDELLRSHIKSDAFGRLHHSAKGRSIFQRPFAFQDRIAEQCPNAAGKRADDLCNRWHARFLHRKQGTFDHASLAREKTSSPIRWITSSRKRSTWSSTYRKTSAQTSSTTITGSGAAPLISISR